MPVNPKGQNGKKKGDPRIKPIGEERFQDPALVKRNRRRMLSHAQSEEARAAIQVSMVVRRLQSFVKGDIEMSNAQVKAAEVLLKKAIPDLTQTQINHTSNKFGQSREELVGRVLQVIARSPEALAALSRTVPQVLEGQVEVQDSEPAGEGEQ